jgi:hypothetical protein
MQQTAVVRDGSGGQAVELVGHPRIARSPSTSIGSAWLTLALLRDGDSSLVKNRTSAPRAPSVAADLLARRGMTERLPIHEPVDVVVELRLQMVERHGRARRACSVNYLATT